MFAVNNKRGTVKSGTYRVEPKATKIVVCPLIKTGHTSTYWTWPSNLQSPLYDTFECHTMRGVILEFRALIDRYVGTPFSLGYVSAPGCADQVETLIKEVPAPAVKTERVKFRRDVLIHHTHVRDGRMYTAECFPETVFFHPNWRPHWYVEPTRQELLKAIDFENYGMPDSGWDEK